MQEGPKGTRGGASPHAGENGAITNKEFSVAVHYMPATQAGQVRRPVREQPRFALTLGGTFFELSLERASVLKPHSALHPTPRLPRAANSPAGLSGPALPLHMGCDCCSPPTVPNRKSSNQSLRKSKLNPSPGSSPLIMWKHSEEVSTVSKSILDWGGKEA